MRSSNTTDLKTFQELWRRNLSENAEDDSAFVHQQLVDAYNEPQRVYHTLDHIRHCLELLLLVRDDLHNADALELAIWFHDAIYVPGADNNEQLSADWFMQCTKNCLKSNFREQVYKLIMVTLHCGKEIDDHDAKFMVDIDLSSFGMPWEQFIHDSENVRRELPNMTDAEFYPRQCAFSKGLLGNTRFFQSAYFFEHYETQARTNLSDYYHLIKQKLSTDE